MSLRSRLLLASVTVLLVGLVAADAVTYLAVRSSLRDQLVERLSQLCETIEHAAHQGPLGGAGPVGPSGAAGPVTLAIRSVGPVAPTYVYLEQRAPDGRVIAAGSAGPDERGVVPDLPDPLPVPPGPAGPRRDGEVPAEVFTADAAAGRPTFLVRTMRDASTGGTILAAIALDDEAGTLTRLLLIEAAVSLVVAGGGAALASWLVRIGLRPLDAIGAAAADIAAGDLSRRVTPADPSTEIGRLGRAVNDMLRTIEAAFSERARSEQEVRESEARLQRFVADASHELRTPLAAVTAYAELLDRTARDHPEVLDRILANLRRESRRMAALVEDLLLLTRLDHHRPLDRVAVDLGALAAESIDAGRLLDPDHALVLAVEGSVEVTGDRLRLRQVVDNLLANARVHTPAGTTVQVRVRAVGDRGELQVTDDGPGLPAEHASRAFERFYRADDGRSREAGGNGLGLAIVRAIVEAHGGTAALSSAPGAGLTVVISLPLLVDTIGDDRVTAAGIAS